MVECVHGHLLLGPSRGAKETRKISMVVSHEFHHSSEFHPIVPSSREFPPFQTSESTAHLYFFTGQSTPTMGSSCHPHKLQNHGRRQQKRQTAGNMIGNFLKGGGGGGGNGGRKKTSTAQPRPQILIPPKGIGPVHDINANDVLCGRGGRINAHTGNVQFREIVQLRKKDYLAKTTKKLYVVYTLVCSVVYNCVLIISCICCDPK